MMKWPIAIHESLAVGGRVITGMLGGCLIGALSAPSLQTVMQALSASIAPPAVMAPVTFPAAETICWPRLATFPVMASLGGSAVVRPTKGSLISNGQRYWLDQDSKGRLHRRLQPVALPILTLDPPSAAHPFSPQSGAEMSYAQSNTENRRANRFSLLFDDIALCNEREGGTITQSMALLPPSAP